MADLPPMLQEETLDEIESLVDDPTRLVFRGAARIAIHDFVRFYAGHKYTVFVRVQRDNAANLLRLRTIGHAKTTEPPPAAQKP